MGIIHLRAALDEEHQFLVPLLCGLQVVLERGHVTAGCYERNRSVVRVKDRPDRPADAPEPSRRLEPLLHDAGIRRPEEPGHLGCDNI
jgi:hypothetical protein